MNERSRANADNSLKASQVSDDVDTGINRVASATVRKLAESSVSISSVIKIIVISLLIKDVALRAQGSQTASNDVKASALELSEMAMQLQQLVSRFQLESRDTGHDSV